MQWSAEETGSGIRGYDVEVKVDDGDWVRWATGITQTQDTYDGELGHTYAFRVRATDNVSNTGTWVEASAKTVVVKKYYYAAGQRVAMRANGVIYCLHGDHLGSTSLTTDISGTVVAEQKYLPYGAARWVTGTLATDFGYTGQRSEDFGLMDYHARYYSPYLARFISADSITPEPWSSQAWNRYTYVSNNPVKYVDPTGHLTESQIREYTDYDTDAELDNLERDHNEFYQLLRKMHLGDWLHGDRKSRVWGKVMLNDLGRLRVDGCSAKELLELESSGWVLLRDFGDGTTYQVYQYGEEVFGGYFGDTVKCPPELMYEYEERISAGTSFAWALPDFLKGEFAEAVLDVIWGGLGVLFGMEQALEEGVSGRPPGHVRDDAIFRSYYAVDYNPTTGEKLEFLQIWVETTIVRGNRIVEASWTVTSHRR